MLIDLSAGLVLAFALALIYLVGGFTITGSASQVLLPDAEGDFQRIAVVMTILGLTGGMMIEQVAARLRAWLAERLPGHH